ncbi:MAG: hypothetical protein ACOZNI_10110 [Myxococcota bacterium]
MRWLAAAIAAAVCVAEGLVLAGGRAAPVVVTREAPAHAPYTEGPSALEPAFLARMTPDDVARGVWGLAGERGELALTADQRAALAPLLARGAETRAALGTLRARRGEAEAAMLAAAAEALR